MLEKDGDLGVLCKTFLTTADLGVTNEIFSSPNTDLGLTCEEYFLQQTQMWELRMKHFLADPDYRVTSETFLQEAQILKGGED